jgi:outer membrane scaffolding protein for murein synthesis (MipA/OmpV family)
MARAPTAGRRFATLVAAIIGSAWTSTVDAREEPLWELGAGVGAIAFEDYRGSDTVHGYPLPIPYFIYNGTFFKADRNGVRGTFFDQDWLEFNLSGNLTTPVRNDRARSGMPNLKSTLELGPSIDVHLARSADARIKLDLRLPARAAFTVDAPPQYIGWTFSPRLALDVNDPPGLPAWNLGLLAGPLFADRRYDDYFYSVAGAFATAGRPAYQAAGGYAGTQSILAVSKRFPRYWFGAYARYDTLADASFADSPLVRRLSYWSAGFGFAWIIRTSPRYVDVPD